MLGQASCVVKEKMVGFARREVEASLLEGGYGRCTKETVHDECWGLGRSALMSVGLIVFD
jgi:hypothetical protein